MPKNGNGLAIMLGSGSASGDESGEPEIDHMEAFQDAAESAMLALKEGDASSFADHLKDAIEICIEQHEGGAIDIGSEEDY